MIEHLFRKYFPWFLFLFGFLMLVWFIRDEEPEERTPAPTPSSIAVSRGALLDWYQPRLTLIEERSAQG